MSVKFGWHQVKQKSIFGTPPRIRVSFHVQEHHWDYLFGLLKAVKLAIPTQTYKHNLQTIIEQDGSRLLTIMGDEKDVRRGAAQVHNGLLERELLQRAKDLPRTQRSAKQAEAVKNDFWEDAECDCSFCNRSRTLAAQAARSQAAAQAAAAKSAAKKLSLKKRPREKTAPKSAPPAIRTKVTRYATPIALGSPKGWDSDVKADRLTVPSAKRGRARSKTPSRSRNCSFVLPPSRQLPSPVKSTLTPGKTPRKTPRKKGDPSAWIKAILREAKKHGSRKEAIAKMRLDKEIAKALWEETEGRISERYAEWLSLL